MLGKTPGAAKPNVRVHVRRRIVQVERKHARIRLIVPIAAADEAACAPFTSLT